MNKKFKGGRSILCRPLGTFLAARINNEPIGLSVAERRAFYGAEAHRSVRCSLATNISDRKRLLTGSVLTVSGRKTCTSRKRTVTTGNLAT